MYVILKETKDGVVVRTFMGSVAARSSPPLKTSTNARFRGGGGGRQQKGAHHPNFEHQSSISQVVAVEAARGSPPPLNSSRNARFRGWWCYDFGDMFGGSSKRNFTTQEIEREHSISWVVVVMEAGKRVAARGNPTPEIERESSISGGRVVVEKSSTTPEIEHRRSISRVVVVVAARRQPPPEIEHGGLDFGGSSGRSKEKITTQEIEHGCSLSLVVVVMAAGRPPSQKSSTEARFRSGGSKRKPTTPKTSANARFWE